VNRVTASQPRIGIFAGNGNPSTNHRPSEPADHVTFTLRSASPRAATPPGLPVPRRLLLQVTLLGTLVQPLAAQRSDSVPCPTDTGAAARQVLARADVIRWYHVAAVVAGTGVLMALDEPVQRYAQRHRSHESNEIAEVFRQEGEAPYYAGVSLGVLGLGLVTGDAGIRRAGTRLVASVALSAAEMTVLKHVIGRSRPNEGVGAFKFHPFTSLKDSAGVETRGSFPSGHTTAAFAVATSLADDIKGPVADILLYTAATGTAFSRINDNRHWLSDTAFGAALGIFTAKVVNGHWRIFGIRPPEFLVTPGGAPCVEWSGSF
jgi:membrane-associated phospholipid phosphatase